MTKQKGSPDSGISPCDTRADLRHNCAVTAIGVACSHDFTGQRFLIIERGWGLKTQHLALAMVIVVALGGVLFGVRYMRRESYLPYHAVVAGKAFTELGPSVQAMILGMLKIILRTFRPGAPTPVRPTCVMTILIVIGVGPSLLAQQM